MLSIEINRSSLVPLYAQLSDAIRAAIMNGDLAYGDKLPSENELTAQYGLSRMTVRSAMADLVSKKLIEKYQGQGAFVCYDHAQLSSRGSIDVLLDTSYVYFSGYYIHSISSVLSRRGYSFLIHDTWSDQNRIAELLGKTKIERIFCTGATAHALYRKHCERETGIEAVRLPSTSPANCAVSFEELVEEWGEIRD